MTMETTFTIGLADLARLSTAVCELDGLKSPRDGRLIELVGDCHGIIIRTLGDQVGRVYAPDDEQQQVAA